jgi:hypothetical protein
LDISLGHPLVTSHNAASKETCHSPAATRLLEFIRYTLFISTSASAAGYTPQRPEAWMTIRLPFDYQRVGIMRTAMLPPILRLSRSAVAVARVVYAEFAGVSSGSACQRREPVLRERGATDVCGVTA